jgi:predicted nuclease with TOPRIM domain
MLRK